MAATGFYPDEYRDSRIVVQYHRPQLADQFFCSELKTKKPHQNDEANKYGSYLLSRIVVQYHRP